MHFSLRCKYLTKLFIHQHFPSNNFKTCLIKGEIKVISELLSMLYSILSGGQVERQIHRLSSRVHKAYYIHGYTVSAKSHFNFRKRKYQNTVFHNITSEDEKQLKLAKLYEVENDRTIQT